MEAKQKANAEVMQRANAARAACEAQYPTAHVKKVDCLTQAENTILRPVYRYGELLDLFQAQRKRLAVRVDLGETKLDDAMVEYAQMRVSLVEEERRRNNESTMMAAQVLLQQQAVNAQTIGALAPMMMQQRIQPNPEAWRQLQASPAPTLSSGIPIPTVTQPLHCDSQPGILGFDCK